VFREIRRWDIDGDEHVYTLILSWDDALGLPGVYEALECPCCARTSLEGVEPTYVYDVDGWESSWDPDGHEDVRGVVESFRSELRRVYQEHYGTS
jgi:hypothetical protein